MGTVDLLKINSCSIKSSDSTETNFVIDIIKNKSADSNIPSANVKQSDLTRLEISTNSPNECILYVHSLNFVIQLVKCKAYAFKGSDKGRN